MGVRKSGKERLLRFMVEHGTAEMSGFDADRRLLMAANGGRIIVTGMTVGTLQRNALLVVRGSIVELTPVGHAAAKRVCDEGETPFAEQHRTTRSANIVMDDGARQDVRINTEESPLARSPPARAVRPSLYRAERVRSR